MSITAIASVASGLAGGRAAERFDPAYGLAHRFTVEIRGLDIGRWQSCSGLRVDFKPAEIKAGGRYDSLSYLPGEVAYPKVVLGRAVAAKHTAGLQKWLNDTAHAWVNGERADGVPATITLFDSYGEAVLAWKLNNARAAAWSCTNLDANSSKVALETLELVHEGFVVEVGGKPPGNGAAAGQPGKLTLTDGSNPIEFAYPPSEIQVEKSQQPSTTVRDNPLTTANQAAEVNGDQLEFTRNRANTTTYVLKNLILEGTGVRGHVEQLTAWATKAPTSTSGKAEETPTLPPITFTWGDGFKDIAVRLTSLSVTYTRFSPRGVPIRAKVGLLKLDERTPTDAARGGATNPSSGGIPGRGSHLMVASETLPALAQETYGRPNRWRAIARANDVDDPLRVRAGTTVFLPAPSEVHGEMPGEVRRELAAARGTDGGART